MSLLVTVPTFRLWAGAAISTVPDALVQACLDESEAGITADLGTTIQEILLYPEAETLAKGETLRRSQRLLARRNSPEGVAGFGDLGVILVPSRDPDSQRTIYQIASVMGLPEGVA